MLGAYFDQASCSISKGLGMSNLSTTDQVKEHFKIICRKCGSESIVIDIDGGTVYSEMSSDPPSVTIGCNNCGQNDLQLF